MAHRDLKPENSTSFNALFTYRLPVVLDINGHVKLWELSFTKIIMDKYGAIEDDQLTV